MAIVAAIISGAPGTGTEVLKNFFPIAVTIVLFLVVVFAQSLKVEIPLAFDRVRGHSVKWPLNFFYSGVMPDIFVSALAANVQLFGSMVQVWLGHATWLGGFASGGQAISGLSFWIGSTPILETLITGSFRWIFTVQAVGHILFYTLFSVLFAFFWVNTSGQDARSQANKIVN